MVVGQIVKKARRKLGDQDSTGWDDETLIDYVDQGQKDICKMSAIYKRIFYLGLLNNVKLYSLPQDCFQVDRVEHMGENIATLSREDSDIRFTEKGFHAIKSSLNMDTIEFSETKELSNYMVYVRGTEILDADGVIIDPIVGVEAQIELVGCSVASDTGVIVGFEEVEPEEALPAEYGDISGVYRPALVLKDSTALGCLTDLEFNCGSDMLGFLSSVDGIQVEGTYGICTEALAPSTYVKVYYAAITSTVNSLFDALVLKDIWEKALVHYVVGTARQDDNDEGSYSIGVAELDAYAREVSRAKKLSAKSYSSSVDEIRETTYRRI